MLKHTIMFGLTLGLCFPALGQCPMSAANKTAAGDCHVAASAAVALGALGETADKDIVDTAVAAGSFKTLAAALEAADLVDALKGKGPFTVFAPTDEAFAKLPKETLADLLKPENKKKLVAILTYHVVPGSVMADKVVDLKFADTLNGQRVDIMAKGGKVMIDNANVIKTDIACSNGVIHVIDAVILPQTKDVVEVANEAGSFATLLAAAKAAGLVEALKGDGPITVFAPNDAAFAKLGPDAITDLVKPENKKKLADILKYHVVSGRIYSDQAIKAGKATTLQGSPVTITSKGEEVMINNATVIGADIEASNGVIHVIDTVIMPSK